MGGSKEFMEKIESLSKSLKKIEKRFKEEHFRNNLINVIGNCKCIEFSKNHKVAISTKIGNSGCYFFEIRINDKEYGGKKFISFEQVWSERKKSQKIPNCHKTNIKKVCKKINYDFYKDQWYPLYVGKAEKDLSSRIMQHIKCDSVTTLALKLFNDEFKDDSLYDSYFRLRWIELPSNTVRYCERILHEELHPIAGKK